MWLVAVDSRGDGRTDQHRHDLNDGPSHLVDERRYRDGPDGQHRRSRQRDDHRDASDISDHHNNGIAASAAAARRS